MRSGLLAVAALGLMPAAQAQNRPDYCETYETLMAAAPERFVSYRGAERMPGLWASTLRLPSFPVCVVYETVESAILCHGPVGDEALNRFSFEAERKRLRSCFGDWRTESYIDAPGDYVLVDGVRLVRDTPGGELTIGVILGRETATDKQRYLVGFAVMLTPLDLGV